jgi:hypothetical protein
MEAKRILPLAVTAWFLTAAAGIVTLLLLWLPDRPPVQPIAFPHPTHINKVGLACTHCHTTADKSPRAGVPAMSICMACHENAATDRPEVQKLRGYWDRKEPIPWIKIHILPWHVRFTHKRHIKAGVDCSVCHGDVRAMMPMRQVRSLKMGWCIGCHRSRGAATDCAACHK